MDPSSQKADIELIEANNSSVLMKSETSNDSVISSDAPDNKSSLISRVMSPCTKRKKDIKEVRTLKLNSLENPPSRCPNVVKNTKYNAFTFVPLVLYNQFKFFYNMFFLVIALSQFVPILQVGFLFTYIGPLAIVLGFTMLKEAYDDFIRYQRDKEANSKTYSVIESNGQRSEKPSSELKVGDVVEIKANERVPADFLLLQTSEANGTMFIKTDQLDGETDWKLRRAVRYTQSYYETHLHFQGIQATLKYGAPHENIYEFDAVFEAEVGNAPKINEFLSLDNTIWANTIITTGSVVALVIYTGRETRISLNSRSPRTKVGKTDEELNFLSKLLFVFMVLISLVFVALKGFSNTFYLDLFKYILLLSSIIPISLRVNLDFAKAIFSFKINRDQTIPGTIARNSNIPEELGRISYLLSDKTGTLTKNEMHFKRLVLEHAIFDRDNLPLLFKTLQKQCEKYDGPMNDVENKRKELLSINESSNSEKSRGGKFRRDKDCIVRDFITALAVCHNVTPIIEGGLQTFHASSPDEIALVNFASEIKMKLIERTGTQIIIQNPIGNTESYTILANFPFSSETKRMGILLRQVESNRILFFLKGADMAIQPRVKEVYRSLVMDECESLARMGLRTLVVACKYITEEEYQAWNQVWEEANRSITNRNAEIRKAGDLLEVDLDLLGITGVEDKLQDEINDVLESVRNAGIKVWMLTGDKVETAKCVAIACGLKSQNQQIFEIREASDEIILVNQINEFSNKHNCVLLIDGAALTKILANHSQIFFDAAVRAPAVICCRCLPTQKAIVTELVKKFSGERVACIGDGGNDVGMIQAADLGLGIVGKEGKQAALASDFSIMEFKCIKPLIFWHGRLYYKNSSKLSQFIIHRGLIISFIQVIFIATFYFVTIPIYNGYLTIGYSTIYTMFPVFCLILDEDVSRDKALAFPVLYKTLHMNRELNTKSFLVWSWKSIFQGSVIMLLSLELFEQSFLQIVTITFSALIVLEILNISTEIHKYQMIMFASQVTTILVYFASIVLFRNYFDVDSIDGNFVVNVLAIICASWLPMHIIKKFFSWYDPTDYQKVMKRL